jgi:glycosyltransferase involved in cell wall biosynthesis
MSIPGHDRISVLMACYNADRFVAGALESIRRQTHSNFEVIVVDDGSTDNSAAIVGRFVGDKVRIVRQQNRGAACARNEAFRHSTGDYVLFMDADDIVAPTHLQSLLQRASETRGCIALSRWARFQSDPAEAQFPSRLTERDLPGPDWLELDWRAAQPMTQSGMLLLPRSLLEIHGGWDERLSLNDDFEFFARQISRCSGVRFAPDARLYYRSAVAGSLSGRKSRAAVESAYLSMELGTRHLLSIRDTSATRKICANLMKDFEYTYFPAHADLRAKARKRIAELGGSDLAPNGPPGFHRLRPWIGWKAARLAQRATAILKLRRLRNRKRSAHERAPAID